MELGRAWGEAGASTVGVGGAGVPAGPPWSTSAAAGAEEGGAWTVTLGAAAGSEGRDG